MCSSEHACGVGGQLWVCPCLPPYYRGLFIYCCTHRRFWGFCPDLSFHRGNTGTSDTCDFVSFSWDLGNLNSGLHAYTACPWPPSCLPKMLPFTGFDYYLALVIVLSRIGDWAWHFRAVRDCHPVPEPLDFLLGEGDKVAEFASVQLFGVISMAPGKERRAGRLPFQ